MLGELRPNQFGTTAGLWHLNGNSTDSSGNGYHLTNNNSASFGSGKFGNCVDFGTGNTNKTLSINNKLGIDGGAISISCWVKMNAELTSGAERFFVMHGSSVTDTANIILYNYNAGTKRLEFWRLRQGTAIDQVNYNISLGTSNWHHLAFTYDATNVKAYYNGSLIGTQAASGNGGTNQPDVFSIGGQTQASGAYYVDAKIDEVHVVSTALTANQIRTMYALGRGLYY